jgi:hypothetical protein
LVSKESLLKYGSLAILVIFVVELFISFTYNSPTQATLTPTPSAQPREYFVGNGTALAKVESLDDELTGLCNTSQSVSRVLQGIPGVLSAVEPAVGASGTLLSVSFDSNASANFDEFYSKIEDALKPYCEPSFYRWASVSFNESFTASNGTSDKSVSPEDVSAYEAYSGRQAKAVVSLDSGVNSTVKLFVSLAFVDSQLYSIQGEELAKAPESVSFEADAIVKQTLGEALVSKKVNWSERNSVNETVLGKELEKALGKKIELTYSRTDLVRVKGGSALNKTLVDSLPFVETSFDLGEELVIVVKQNFTDSKALENEVLGSKSLPVSFEYPNSTIEANFNTSDSGYAVDKQNTLSVLAGGEFRRRAIAELLSGNYSAYKGYPKTQEMFLYNPVTNQSLKLEVEAIVQGNTISSFQITKVIE